MLVLTRRVGEEIVIAGDVRITVRAVRGGRVRLGIAAPGSIQVDRREVSERRCEVTGRPGRQEITSMSEPVSTELE